ncbi:hypothetical protein [Micromonospora cathayae]|uniref:Kelch motif-containing protein n=1 Tax=Micromonospora cathayae TaxID=3028804 RepID=A0ABY7ZQW7_9ACTN|nr:hypothetical protein [Micromonospora sp. HUAS 3]WDZ84264.1 hypothetical protein PVK37_28030 [Micromonospora sp. HUAS 3]
MSSRRAVALLALVAVLSTACEPAADPDAAAPPPITPAWQPVTLPAPPGPPGRLLVRDAAACADRWYVLGGVADAAGATRPAAWTSADGTTWTSIAMLPKSYYGKQHVLYSVACRDGRVALLGSKRGGAHANPRTSSWRQLPDGSLAEVTAPFELFGGPRAVNVARMVAGPPGWLITGNRTGGAASWVSPDSNRFTIVEGAPELASDARGETWGFDAVGHDGRWLMVGGLVPAGRTDRDPLAWTSADGVAWQRVPVPGGPEYDELQRVVLLDGVPVAVGLRGRAFGTWRADAAPADGSPAAGGGPATSGTPTAGGDAEAGGWRVAGGFGTARVDGVPGIRGLTVVAGRLVAVTVDGGGHALWASTDRGDSWRSVEVPVSMPAGAERSVALAASGERLLLVVDDASAGRVFLASLPGD